MSFVQTGLAANVWICRHAQYPVADAGSECRLELLPPHVGTHEGPLTTGNAPRGTEPKLYAFGVGVFSPRKVVSNSLERSLVASGEEFHQRRCLFVRFCDLGIGAVCNKLFPGHETWMDPAIVVSICTVHPAVELSFDAPSFMLKTR